MATAATPPMSSPASTRHGDLQALRQIMTLTAHRAQIEGSLHAIDNFASVAQAAASGARMSPEAASLVTLVAGTEMLAAAARASHADQPRAVEQMLPPLIAIAQGLEGRGLPPVAQPASAHLRAAQAEHLRGGAEQGWRATWLVKDALLATRAFAPDAMAATCGWLAQHSAPLAACVAADNARHGRPDTGPAGEPSPASFRMRLARWVADLVLADCMAWRKPGATGSPLGSLLRGMDRQDAARALLTGLDDAMEVARTLQAGLRGLMRRQCARRVRSLPQDAMVECLAGLAEVYAHGHAIGASRPAPGRPLLPGNDEYLNGGDPHQRALGVGNLLLQALSDSVLGWDRQTVARLGEPACAAAVLLLDTADRRIRAGDWPRRLAEIDTLRDLAQAVYAGVHARYAQLELTAAAAPRQRRRG